MIHDLDFQNLRAKSQILAYVVNKENNSYSTSKSVYHKSNKAAKWTLKDLMNGLRKTKSNLQCQQKPASQFPTPPMNTCKYRPKYVKNPNCLRKLL